MGLGELAQAGRVGGGLRHEERQPEATGEEGERPPQREGGQRQLEEPWAVPERPAAPNVRVRGGGQTPPPFRAGPNLSGAPRSLEQSPATVLPFSAPGFNPFAPGALDRGTASDPAQRFEMSRNRARAAIEGGALPDPSHTVLLQSQGIREALEEGGPEVLAGIEAQHRSLTAGIPGLRVIGATGAGATASSADDVLADFSAPGASLVTLGDDIARLRSPDNFRVLENQEPVSPLDSLLSTPNPRDVSVLSLLLLDLSGNAAQSEGGVEAVKNAARSYIAGILGLPVAVYTFDGRQQIQPLAPFGLTPSQRDQAIEGLECGDRFCLDPSTDLNGSVIQALDALDVARANASQAFVETALVVFSYGSDQAGRVPFSSLQPRLESTTSRVFVVGIDGAAGEDDLQRIGQDGYVAGRSVQQIDSAFRTIAAGHPACWQHLSARLLLAEARRHEHAPSGGERR